MKALMLIKQAEYEDNNKSIIDRYHLNNPYFIGAGLGSLGTGLVAYNIAKGKINNLKLENEDLSKKIKAQADQIDGYKKTINYYQDHLKTMGAPEEVLKMEAPKPGFFKKTFGALKTLFKSRK